MLSFENTNPCRCYLSHLLTIHLIPMLHYCLMPSCLFNLPLTLTSCLFNSPHSTLSFMWTQTSPFSREAKRRTDFNKTFLGKNRKELNHEQKMARRQRGEASFHGCRPLHRLLAGAQCGSTSGIMQWRQTPLPQLQWAMGISLAVSFTSSWDSGSPNISRAWKRGFAPHFSDSSIPQSQHN